MLDYLVALYSVLIGIFMIGFWIFATYSGIIPEEEKPWGIRFHLLSEFTTAILLIVSRIASTLNIEWAKSTSLLALGMLFYIVIYSPGYYLQKKNKPMAIMFISLILLTILAISFTIIDM
jgi:hypothetical protein